MLVDRLNRPRIAFLLIIISLSSGCTFAHIQLKEQPSGIFDFNVEENYEIVFRRVTQQAKQCYETRGRLIEANLFQEKKMAEVIIAIVYLGIPHTLLTAEIKALAPDNTRINTYYSYSPPGAWRDGAYTIQRWAASEEPYCPR